MNRRSALSLLFIALFILFFLSILSTQPVSTATGPAVAVSAGAVLWTGRTFEVVLQALIILAGVISILLILGSGRGKERSG